MRINDFTFRDYVEYAAKNLAKSNRKTIHPEFEIARLDPIILDGPITGGERFQKHLFRDVYRIPELHIDLLENAIVTGADMIFTEDGYAVCGGQTGVGVGKMAFVAPWSELSMQELGAEEFLCEQIRNPIEIDSAYVIAAAAPGSYHHILLDIIPRLTLLDSELGGAFVAANSGVDEVPILLNTGDAFLRAFAKQIGIGDSRLISIPQNGSLKIKKLFVPSLLNDFQNFVSPEIHRFYSGVMRRLGVEADVSPFGNKIFSLRRDYNRDRRAIHNVDQLADILMSEGYKEIFPETMSWRDEMVAFSSADYIVGPMGSNLSNMVFCKPQAAVLCVQSNDSGFNLNTAMAAAGGQRIGYVFGEAFSNPSRGEHVEYYIDPDLFRQGLKAMREYEGLDS